jgi:hypothetical protein
VAQPDQKPNRRNRGFLQTNGLLTRQIRAASEKRGFAETRLLTQWVEIVGEETARMGQPIKIGYSKQGFGASLTVLCKGADAPMLQMQIPQIIERVNACYGYNAIARIKLTQTAPTGFHEPKTGFEHKQPEPEITPTQREVIETSLQDVADSDLKKSLQLLGENIVKRKAKPKEL